MPSSANTRRPTALGSATQETTTSETSASSLGVRASRAPRSTSGFAFSGVRFQTASGNPLSRNCRAMRLPMRPSPANPMRCGMRSLLLVATILRLGLGVARGVRADVAEGALATGHVRRPRLEPALADERGDLPHHLLRARRLLEGGTLAAREPRLQEAQLDAVGQAARGAQVGQRVDVELQALLRALGRLLRIVHGARLEVQDRGAP